jgi:hypothetical protein
MRFGKFCTPLPAAAGGAAVVVAAGGWYSTVGPSLAVVGLTRVLPPEVRVVRPLPVGEVADGAVSVPGGVVVPPLPVGELADGTVSVPGGVEAG